MVSDPELRFFLGLLACFTDIKDIASHISARYGGGDPLRRISLWYSDLVSLGVFGVIPSDSVLSALQSLFPKLDCVCKILEGQPLFTEPSHQIQEVVYALRDNWLMGHLIT
jgi:hypothetical protein